MSMSNVLNVSQLAKGLVLVQLNRPDRLNALSEEMALRIIELCSTLNSDKSCIGVIFTGNLRAFSTGRDLKLSAKHSPDEAKRYSDLACESVLAVAELEIPSCAAIDGHCLGWGYELALACDLRVASKNARLRLPETSLGLFPGAGGAVLLPRVAGRAIANDLIFTAREISGAEALELGVASRLAQGSGSALEAATKVMRQVTENAPLGLRAGKKAMNGCEGISNVREALAATRSLRDPLTFTRDHQEALKAFAEKRRPHFDGR